MIYPHSTVHSLSNAFMFLSPTTVSSIGGGRKGGGRASTDNSMTQQTPVTIRSSHPSCSKAKSTGPSKCKQREMAAVYSIPEQAHKIKHEPSNNRLAWVMGAISLQPSGRRSMMMLLSLLIIWQPCSRLSLWLRAPNSLVPPHWHLFL